MGFDLQLALRSVVEREGSDLHLKVPAPPMIRVQGDLHRIEGTDPVTPGDTERVLREMLTANDRLSEFAREGEIDFSYAVKNLARFRVNAFRQRGSISIVARVVPFSIRENLGLPDVVMHLADESRGMILVTGTTGSGKSTTLAAMVDHINKKYARNIVTVEDPIEYLHRDQRSVIHQREVGFDTASFSKALRRVLRQDPDVILIGEMRDEETVETALSAAETGHLVLSTLHTIDAVETVNRIVDFFPPHQHQQVRAMIAGSLRGVVSQRLVPTADGSARVPACEVLTMTGRVRDMIMDPAQTARLAEVIAEGRYYGMQTFDQSLLELHREGTVSMQEALRAATHPHDFKLLVAAAGGRSGSKENEAKPVEDSNGGEPAETSDGAKPAGDSNGVEPGEDSKGAEPVGDSNGAPGSEVQPTNRPPGPDGRLASVSPPPR